MENIGIKSLSKDELLEKRKEVIRLHKAATPVMQIVRICGLSWPTVNTAINLYIAGGEEALSLAKRGRKEGTGRILSQEQENDIRGILYSKRPSQVGLRHPIRDVRIHLWNRDAVKRLIHHRHGVNLSERGVSKYLYRWGFPLMKKNQRPVKRCKREIQKWLNENYADLKERADVEYADIYWVSKRRIVITDISNDLNWPRRMSMISAVDSHGKEHWIVVRGYFTEKWQARFLKTLASHANKRVFVIRDTTDRYKGGGASYGSKNIVEVFPRPEVDSPSFQGDA